MKKILGATWAAGLLAAGCAGSPTQPIVEFGAGVTLYRHSLYRAEKITLGGDVSDLSKLEGGCEKSSDEYSTSSNFDDCVSSLRIPAGWSVMVFRDRRYTGSAATYSADVPDLDLVTGPCRPGFNDCISSIRVFRP